ncbi:MAG: hypothetical protein RLZZ08_1304 [Pseudomonadota bacterium]|jgi:hypothetical protein
MDLDALLQEYFGTTDLAQATASGQAAGLERLQVDFGLSKDRGQRFALWLLMYTLGAAPDIDVAFKDAQDRDAARDMMELLAGE